MTRKTFAIVVAVALVLGALAFAGCKSAPKSDAGGGATPSKATAAKGDAAKKADPKVAGMKIVLLPKGSAHVFWQTVKAGAEAACQEAGIDAPALQAPPSETDVQEQIKFVENAIAKKVDAIVIAACDSKALIEPLKKAKDAGIIIVTIDSGIDDDSIAVSYAATDNVLGGQKGAQELTELVGGSGKVACVPFIQGAKSSDEREKGFNDEIKAIPTLELTPPYYSDSDAQKAVTVVENLLNAHKDVKGIFAANEPGALGAAQVIESRKLAGQVFVVGYDASKDEIKALKAGVIQALIVQNPFKMGYEGVMAAVKTKMGETVDKRIDTGVTVVTLDNLDSPEVAELLKGMQ